MILLLAGLAAACPSLDAETERTVLALLGGDTTGADVALERAEASLACEPADSASIARWLLVAGATRTLRGADGLAHLAAGRALAPELLDARLGPDVRQAWERAAPDGTATLLLEPALPARIDGTTVTSWPVTLRAGPHALQVVDDAGTVRFGRAITLLPGEDALVPTGLAPDSPAGIESPSAPTSDPAMTMTAAPRRKTALLVTAGGLAATGIALGGAALAQGAAMEAAEDLDTLDAVYGAQRGLAFGAYGAFGAAAVAGALFVVVR
jgi:hypothetical protein